MFGIFQKEVAVAAPVTGQCVDLKQVPDEMFSQRLMGDGVAVDPEDGLFVAPADGELTMVFKTGHAYGMQLDKKVEILVHIGIDTVELNGDGFEVLAQQGQKVKKGTPIVQANLALIRERGYNPITPIIVTLPETMEGTKEERVLEKKQGSVRAGVDPIFKVKP
ncbi:PTS system, beta-glucoside-specific IIB component [Clostridiaceae bacterium JG1575]|nr:PTS system, beta-glucoside-specific IIB component [Clostridiaceae bacterium JG1575]